MIEHVSLRCRGPRKGYAKYAAFVLDPDGHNIEVVIWP